ncbi:hypothetical protein [Cognataquiflexum rubidum]|uniref:hypothetical protein n=1 Tax=Cognataquiflexum rubidum TaxID=2922273 RepID=UPI001F146CA9|nr:hypothetical protein [Cognataquiflexum rubidum]MCH6236485.1 hypothetical protein [Cognataquiflexum rubidum]
MAKIIWICSKEPLNETVGDKLHEICDFLTPDNIVPNRHRIHVKLKVAYGVLNPKTNIKYTGNSVLLGAIYGENENWHIPYSEIPDGSFAIFREDPNNVEIISDVAGSRTIWYFFNETLFIASTSQFAIVKYLGIFNLNRSVIPWMLSTGTMGPEISWDSRVKKLPPNSSILLNKEIWQLTLKINPIVFKLANKNIDQHEKELKKQLNETFRSIKLDFSKWILPLSGGFDSRGLLHFLSGNGITPIRTITWGIEKSKLDTKSDSFIADKLAKKLNVENKFFQTNFSKEDIGAILMRFIKNGEGRIDHLSGYLDGFSIWKEIHEKGIDGVIRGDENFGWHTVNSKKDVFTSLGINFLDEYKNLNSLFKTCEFKQVLPAYFEKNINESIPQWRDRLYHVYRLQTIISALGDLKYSYVEQIVPLLSSKVIHSILTQPDKARSGKKLWKNIVNSFEPKMEYASEQSIANMDGFYSSKEFLNFVKIEFERNMENEIFDRRILLEVLDRIKISSAELSHSRKISLKKIIKRLTPNRIYSQVKNTIKVNKTMDYNLLALRIFIILTVNNLLKNETSNN